MIKKIIVCVQILCVVLALGTAAEEALTPGMGFIARDLKLIKTCKAGEEIRFTKTDFTAALGISDFESITVTSLPDVNSGTLKFGNLDVFKNQIISSGGVEYLRFVPNDNNASCLFTFKSGTSSDVKCMMYVIEDGNSAPTGSSFKLETFCSIPVYSHLRCKDADGDEIEYVITSQPKNGRLLLTNEQCGIFRYSPNDGFTGKDCFTYKGVDKFGNESEVYTVSISTSKSKSGIVYYDMTDSHAHAEAVRLADEGIIVGERIGNNMYFSPDERVTRCDFAVMAMQSAGFDPNVFTGTELPFKDDDTIPNYARGYIATAMKLGAEFSQNDSDSDIFAPYDAISEKDAVSLVNSLLNASGKAALDADEIFAPSIPTGTFGEENAMLTKENCALLLSDLCSIYG